MVLQSWDTGKLIQWWTRETLFRECITLLEDEYLHCCFFFFFFFISTVFLIRNKLKLWNVSGKAKAETLNASLAQLVLKSVFCVESAAQQCLQKNLIKVWTEVTFMVQFEFLFSKSGNDGRKSTKEGETLAPYFQPQSLHFFCVSFSSVWKWEQISAR